MAENIGGSLVAFAGIISCGFMLGEGILVGNGLLDAPSVLGPVCMPPDVYDCKRLLTEQCSGPGLGVLALVPPLVPFSSS